MPLCKYLGQKKSGPAGPDRYHASPGFAGSPLAGGAGTGGLAAVALRIVGGAQALGRGLALEAGRQPGPQRAQALALAGDLQQAVGLQRGGHHVAAQQGLGVLHAFHQFLQALPARTQQVQRGQVCLRAGQAQAGIDDLRVLGDHAERLATEGLRFAAHLGQAFAGIRFQCNQFGQGGFKRRQGVVDGGEFGCRKGEGNQIFGHGWVPVVDGICQ